MPVARSAPNDRPSRPDGEYSVTSAPFSGCEMRMDDPVNRIDATPLSSMSSEATRARERSASVKPVSGSLRG
jgi:hypothetical protein